MELPKWCDGDVGEVLKDVKMLLKIQSEVDLYSAESRWTRFWILDFEGCLEASKSPVRYWGRLQCHLSTSSENWQFAEPIMNDLLHALCDSVLSPVDHSLETLALEHRQHFRWHVPVSACDPQYSASMADCLLEGPVFPLLP